MFRPIKQIKNFFCIMSLASRRLEEYSSTTEQHYKTKKEVIEHIVESIGNEWGNISEIEFRPDRIKVVRWYHKKPKG